MQRARRLASCASPAEVFCEFVGEVSKEPLNHHLLEAGSLPYTGCPQWGRGGACVEGDSRVWAEQLHSLLWAQVTPGQVGAVP